MELRSQYSFLTSIWIYRQVRSRNDKLENHLAEAIEKLKSYHQSGASTVPSTSGTPLSAVANAKLEDVAAELEEQRELANNRLAELDRLHRQHRDTLKEVEKLKMDVSIFLYQYLLTFLHSFFELNILSCNITYFVYLCHAVLV